jgi:hypothetical protein
MPGVEGAPLVAQPASIAIAHSTTTGESRAGRMIRFPRSPSRSGNCAAAWQCDCMQCPARAR